MRTNVPASVYAPEYVAFAEARLGKAEARTLAADAKALEPVARDHRRYAALQQLAWLFRDAAQASRSITRDLSELSEGAVTDASLLARLASFGPEVEVLRCAAALEFPYYERLPELRLEASLLMSELDSVCEAAPQLPAFRVCVVRALGRSGRVRGREIWIGAPFGDAGPTLRHLAWQAAHESTVAELQDLAGTWPSEERAVEAAALVLLGLRAQRVGLATEHQTWFDSFGGRAGAIDIGRLSPTWRERVSAKLTYF